MRAASPMLAPMRKILPSDSNTCPAIAAHIPRRSARVLAATTAQDRGELVAADAEHFVLGAQATLEQGAEFLSSRSPRSMAAVVVDHLEVIEVDVEEVIWSPERRCARTACSIRSSKARRLASPVSGSWRACQAKLDGGLVDASRGVRWFSAIASAIALNPGLERFNLAVACPRRYARREVAVGHAPDRIHQAATGSPTELADAPRRHRRREHAQHQQAHGQEDPRFSASRRAVPSTTRTWPTTGAVFDDESSA